MLELHFPLPHTDELRVLNHVQRRRSLPHHLHRLVQTHRLARSQRPMRNVPALPTAAFVRTGIESNAIARAAPTVPPAALHGSRRLVIRRHVLARRRLRIPAAPETPTHAPAPATLPHPQPPAPATQHKHHDDSSFSCRNPNPTAPFPPCSSNLEPSTLNLDPMHLIDSHAHLDLYTAEDLAAVLARAHAAGVRTILAIGIGDGPAPDAPRTRDRPRPTPTPDLRQRRHPPPGSRTGHPRNPRQTRQARRRPALHRHRRDRPRLLPPRKPRLPDIQQAAFIAQMKIAAAARKPILIHCRTSELATPQAKAKFEPTEPRRRLGRPPHPHHRTLDAHGLAGIMHCFSGTVEQARRSLAARLLPLLRRKPHLPQPPSHPRSRHLRPRRPHPRRNRRALPRPHPPPRPAKRARPRHPHRRSPRHPPRHLTPEALATLTTANFHHLFPTTDPAPLQLAP